MNFGVYTVVIFNFLQINNNSIVEESIARKKFCLYLQGCIQGVLDTGMLVYRCPNCGTHNKYKIKHVMFVSTHNELLISYSLASTRSS